MIQSDLLSRSELPNCTGSDDLKQFPCFGIRHVINIDYNLNLELFQAILIARGLLNHNNYVEVELDGWETWKLEGDPKRKAKLLVMANDWMTDWKAKYNEFISHISDEAKKTVRNLITS